MIRSTYDEIKPQDLRKIFKGYTIAICDALNELRDDEDKPITFEKKKLTLMNGLDSLIDDAFEFIP